MTKKIIYCAILLTLVVTITSCSLNGGDATSSLPPSDLPTVIPKTDPPTQQENLPSKSMHYEQLLTSFVETANSYEFGSGMSGYDTNTLFSKLNSKLNELLLERASLTFLDEDLTASLDEASGFAVAFSEQFEIGTYNYRFVLLDNNLREKILGGSSFLSVQYWSKDEIGFCPLVESITNSGEFTDFIDYRFIAEKGIISIVQLRHTDTSLFEFSYNIFTFEVDKNSVKNCIPIIDLGGNDYWNVSSYDFTFFDPERKIKGVFVSEKTDEDNEYKIDVSVTNQEITFFNIDNPMSRIILVLSDNSWDVKPEV